jgi:hypothetical protein
MMPLEHQVTSQELSQKLKSLGQPQESLFTWYRFKSFVPKMGDTWSLVLENEEAWQGTYEEKCAAFTVGELGEMLPPKINELQFNIERDFFDKSWVAQYVDENYLLLGKEWSYMAETEANARAKMLIYLLKNKLI